MLSQFTFGKKNNIRTDKHRHALQMMNEIHCQTIVRELTVEITVSGGRRGLLGNLVGALATVLALPEGIEPAQQESMWKNISKVFIKYKNDIVQNIGRIN